MKKYISVLIIMSLMFSITACSTKEVNAVEERARAVKVVKVEESHKPVIMQYIGTLNSKDMIDYSFKMSGKLSKIYVKKGDQLKKGDKIAELTKQDIQYAVKAAEAQMLAAKSQYDKAVNGATQEAVNQAKINVEQTKDSFIYAEDAYFKMKQLYEADAVSKQQFEDAKLAYDKAKHTFDKAKEELKEIQEGTRAEDKLSAKAQYDAAKINYEQQQNALNDTVLYAEQEGTIVDILAEENERIGANTPVVKVRSGKQVMNVGIPQQDLESIHIGSKAVIDVDGEKAEGTITYIAEAPDLATRTYNAEIEVSEKKQFRLGSIAKADIHTGDQKGVWIPMDIIFSDGEEYVYVIKDSRAFKRTITLSDMSENNVLVGGIEVGEYVAVSGMKNLNDGSKVNVVK